VLPRSAIGISVAILAFALGASLSGVVLYSYYEYRLTQNEDKVSVLTSGLPQQVQQAEFENVRQKFIVRKPGFFFGTGGPGGKGGAAARLTKTADVNEAVPHAIVTIGKGSDELGSQRRVLLATFEEGGTRPSFTPGAKSYAVPITGLRDRQISLVSAAIAGELDHLSHGGDANTGPRAFRGPRTRSARRRCARPGVSRP